MTPASLIKLVDSLSRSEKRQFKLTSKMQAGSKEYLLLFDLIDRLKNPQVDAVRKAFREQSPNGSWDNTCCYLGKMLLDCLVKAKKEKDVFLGLLHEIQEVQVLQERSLDGEAFRKVKKLQEKAARFQLHWIEYYSCRYELNAYADNNFVGISDEQLVKLQMKAKEILRSVNHIQDHYSLYELLKYRLIHTGRVVSEEGKKKLNDLMLSEMVLVTGKAKSFTSQKLHLLFQSFFFTDIGDYHSALKSFYQLNELMEKNEAFLDNPPHDYLSALNGIIDSLCMLHNPTEAFYYLDKIRQLDKAVFPEYFRYLVRKTGTAQELMLLLRLGRLDEAGQVAAGLEPAVLNSYILIDEEKQSELWFYYSLVSFQQKAWQTAHLRLREIMNQLKLSPQLLVSRAIRLLNMIIYFEKGEFLHLEYEIRAYKRYFAGTRVLRTEKLLFKLFGVAAPGRRLRLGTGDRKKLLADLRKLKSDRYEQQLLKYYDVAGWMEAVLGVPQEEGLMPG